MQFSATNWWVLLDTGDWNSSRVRVFQCSRLDNSFQLGIFVDMGELHFVHSWACYSFHRSFDACYNWTQPLVAYFFHFSSSSLTVSLLFVFEIEFFSPHCQFFALSCHLFERCFIFSLVDWGCQGCCCEDADRDQDHGWRAGHCHSCPTFPLQIVNSWFWKGENIDSERY